MFNLSFPKNYFLFVLVTILFTASAGISLAQISGTGGTIITEISPENPRPDQIVTVSIESFLVDLDRADSITWLVNNEVIARGAGIKQIQFKTGRLGSRWVVDIVVRGTSIGTVTESVTIRPTEVDLLWEAETYIPPFYKGKALPSSKAEITVVAVSQFVTSSGNRLKPSDLIFTWKKDGKVLGNLSGRGKDAIIIEGPRISRATIIEVDVSSLGNSLVGRRVIGISSVMPKVVFYDNDPILGMKYDNAIRNNLTLSNEEVTITAHPYFFSSTKRTNVNFEYSWRVDGSRVNALPDDESSITLRQVGGGEGEAEVSLTLQNINKILQSARDSFSVMFGGFDKDTPFNF